MKNNRKKIIAVALLLVILILGGVSIFVATRISTQRAVAPTAPESKPKAGLIVGECESCGVESGRSCASGLICQPNRNGMMQTDTSAGVCVKKDASGNVTSNCSGWFKSPACTITASIAPPPCTLS